MPRTCTVCSHQKRSEIDRALIAGLPFRNIAKQFSVSSAALVRHKADHLALRLVKATEAKEVAAADDLLGQLQDLLLRAHEVLDRAAEADDQRTVLMAIREARQTIELLMELKGELDRRAQINLLIAPEWHAMRKAFMDSLRAWPVAKIAAARVLAELETKNVTQP